MKELKDAEGYPTPEALDKVVMFDHGDDIKGLVDILQAAWNYAPPIVEDGEDEHFEGKKIKIVTMHTVGWSGNEDLITALQNSRSLFWVFFWMESKRGGHYTFHVPLWAWQRPKASKLVLPS